MTDAGESRLDREAPSAWVCRWAELIPVGGRVLDVACGGGRHSRWLAAHGYAVDAVDRNPVAVAELDATPGVIAKCADIESGPWPYAAAAFSGIVVVNYLYRPLFPHLLGALALDGVLIYETFAAGNERYGRPVNPDFLLKPGELLELVRGRLRVVAYEDLLVADPKPAAIQRICAINKHP